MSDTKLLQAISDRIASTDKKIENGFKEVKNELKKVNERLDKQGTSLAYLEDDTPTIRDFNKPEKRVRKIETKLTI